MADYRWDDEALSTLVQEIINNPEFEEFEDLRDHTPVIAVGAVLYEDDDVFDRVQRKGVGKTACWIVKCPDTVRSLTSGNGVLKGHNDEAGGVEFYIKIDPAKFDTFPEHSKKGFIYNLLSQLRLRKEQDEDSGEYVPVMEDGRPVWDMAKHPAIGFQTLRRFGRIDDTSERILNAAAEAQQKQLHLFDHRPMIPSDREEHEKLEEGLDSMLGGGEEGAPRDVGDDDPEVEPDPEPTAE